MEIELKQKIDDVEGNDLSLNEANTFVWFLFSESVSETRFGHPDVSPKESPVM